LSATPRKAIQTGEALAGSCRRNARI
jgi:hypothetical protein